MYESDMSLDEEEFIREHLSFLIECDGELSESSENSSTQFHSQDDSMNSKFTYFHYQIFLQKV